MTSEKSNKAAKPEELAEDVAVEAAEPAPEPDAPDQLDVTETDAPATDAAEVNPAAPTAPRGASAPFLALVAGGVVAGVIGFALGRIDQTSGWIFGTGVDVGAENAQAIAGMKGQIGDVQSKILALNATMENQAATTVDLLDRTAAIGDISNRTEQLASNLTALDRRLQDLENRPIPDIGATQEAVAAYEEQLAGMRAMLADELARIEAVQAKALADQTSLQSETRSAAFVAATARLAAQAETGGDMGEALQTLRDLNTSIPPVLETHSAGVSSTSSLTARFPDVARATLDRAIEIQAETGEISGFQAFVQKQLGARSLTPREGDDADAVLARAEAELAAGNLQAAVAEAARLQPMAVPALDSWLSDANIHISVQQAIAALEPNSAE